MYATNKCRQNIFPYINPNFYKTSYSRCNNHISSEHYAPNIEPTVSYVVPHANGVNNVIKEKSSTDLSSSEKCDSFVNGQHGKSQSRYNVFGIQMLSKNLYQQLFENSKLNIDAKKVERCIRDLKKYDLLNKQMSVPDVNLNLPTLAGTSLEEHFQNIAEEQCLPYKKLLLSLLSNIPEVPDNWLLEPGWTRYSAEGVEKVDFPLENALVFDVEVCLLEGDMPTLATAVSNKAWYGWVSKDLINGSNNLDKTYTLDRLINLESGPTARGCNIPDNIKRPRIVVGHNVSFDRARVKEQYWLERTGLRFFDTLSLHVCVSGVTSYQKSLLKAGLGEEEWSTLSSLNSLSKVHKLYCGNEITKEDRELFVSGTLLQIRDNFQSLISYCANDVKATHSVLMKLFPMFLLRFPHPVTLAGMLELQCAYIPLNSNWEKYINESNQAYEDLDIEAKCLLSQSANEACHLMHKTGYKKDIWLWDQDWNTRRLKLTKKRKYVCNNIDNVETVDLRTLSEASNSVDTIFQQFEKKFATKIKKKYLLPLKMPNLPGYPAWYSKLCLVPQKEEWIPGPVLISTGMQIAPKLLQLTWKTMPLHYKKGSGWGYMVPFNTDIPIEPIELVPLQQLIEHCEKFGVLCSCKINIESYNSDITWNCTDIHVCEKLKTSDKCISNVYCRNEIEIGCGLIKLPHKDGGHLNVGNPLARDFINKFSEHGLSGSCKFAQRIIEISRMLSYWRNNRDRIEKQLVCWLNKKDLPMALHYGPLVGAILPQVIVCGTLTRRAVEPTWMTASNAIVERIGSELRGMVQAPAGFSIVGADVDSQELWIASLLGDAYSAGMHGATPFGWMTLNGQKNDGTDMHSVTAKVIGISRHHAKIINYARIYGAGQMFAERLLRQFNPDMGVDDAHNKASKMFTMTKGTKVYTLKENILPNCKERNFSKAAAYELCMLYNKTLSDLFHAPHWINGTESAMFNCLEEIARKPLPETPFLKSRLSRALEPRLDCDDRHLPTRVNWVVQSGAVDFLHLMLVSMRWFLGPTARFCLSFHDEVRYLVPNKYKYEVALALHVTNLLTRSFCVRRLGMSDLPLSVAFFSSVEIDTVLRKESNDDNITPSNPYGLSKGYGIPKGESLNIYEAIKKANGVIGYPRKQNTNKNR